MTKFNYLILFFLYENGASFYSGKSVYFSFRNIILKLKSTLKKFPARNANIIWTTDGSRLQISVWTTPGCKQFTVIPVPFSFSANTLVNKMLHNFVLLYIRKSDNNLEKVSGYAFKSFWFKRAHFDAVDVTFTIRLGADVFILSTNSKTLFSWKVETKIFNYFIFSLKVAYHK